MGNEESIVKDRVDWIDCSKGIAILLTIVGHCVDGILRAVIFSFHMPLFFIMSGITYNFSINKQQFFKKMKKSFMHLFLPAIALWLLQIGVEIILNFSESLSDDCGKTFLRDKLLAFVFSSGVAIPAKVSVCEGGGIGTFGMLWFLIVLFWGRTLFDFLHLYMKDRLYLVCIILSLTGVVISRELWLPFSLDIVFAIMPFFYVGKILKPDIGNSSFLLAIFFFVAWTGAVIATAICSGDGGKYMELAVRRYPAYPLCYIAAIAGTLTMVEISKLIIKYVSRLANLLMFLGKNSIYMYGIHALDYIWKNCWDMGKKEVTTVVLRLVEDTAIFIIVICIRNCFNAASRSGVKDF